MLIAGTLLLITGMTILAYHATSSNASEQLLHQAASAAWHHQAYREGLAGYVLSLAGIALTGLALARLCKRPAKNNSITLDFSNKQNKNT